MESFKWGPHFVTGIDEIDVQHYRLVSILNKYGTALTENVLDREVLDNTLGDLTEYAQVHFETEEKMMMRMSLDQRHIKRHIQEHVYFVNEVKRLAGSINPENQKDYRTLLEFLIHWLAYHILGIDQVMARQMAAVCEGKTPGDAYLEEKQGTDDSTEPLLAALIGLFSLVSKHNRALLELNRTLEERIHEQTEDLLKANQELEIISVTDHLTKLPNRRYAMQQLRMLFDEARQAGQILACLMIDADGFKQVNDTYGHNAGDVVLRRLARELKHSVRSDDIVCRLGGDEFLVICTNTILEGAVQLGEQVRANVAELHVPAGEGFWDGSVSIGVAVSVPGMEDADVLLKMADEAVYIAKQDGRNCVRKIENI